MQLTTQRPAPTGRRGLVVSLLTMVLATLALAAPALDGDRVLAAMDFTTATEPFAQSDLASDVANPLQGDQAGQLVFPLEFWSSARHGDLQFWEPDVGGGTPLGAAVYNRVLSPFNLVTLSWLPPAQGITASVMLALLVAQLGTWWLARRLGLGYGPATLAAVVYGFSGASVTLLLRIQEVAWFPLVLALLHGAMTADEHRGPWRVGFAASVTLLWFCGFPGGAIFALVGVGAAMLSLTIAAGGSARTQLSRLVVPSVAVLAGTMVACVQLLPTLAFIEASNARGRTFLAQPFIGLTRFADAVIPGFFGSHADRTWWWTPSLQSWRVLIGRTSGNPVQAGGGFGLVAATCMVIFARSRRIARGRDGLLLIASTLTVLGLFLAYLGGPLLLLLQQLPTIGETNPARSRFLMAMGVALFVGAGAERVLAEVPEATDRRSVVVARVARWTAGLVLVCGVLALAAGLQAAHESGNLGTVARALVPTTIVAVVGVTLWAVARARAGALAMLVPVLAVLAAFELIAGQWGHQPAVSAQAIGPRLPVLEELPLRGDARFISTRGAPLYVHSTAILDIPDARTIWPGTGRYEDLLTILDPSVGVESAGQAVTWGLPTNQFDPTAPLLDRLAVRDVLQTVGALPIDLEDADRVALEVVRHGPDIEVQLPALPVGTGTAATRWRWLNFEVAQDCPVDTELVASRDGTNLARRRMAIRTGERIHLAIPDLSPGPLTLTATDCGLAVDVVAAFPGSTDQVQLVEVDGWQRYTNLGARPMLEVTSDVIVESDVDARLELLSTDFEGVVVEAAPPGPLGAAGPVAISAMDPDAISFDVRADGGWVLLVFRENNAPGWQATIDGAPADVIDVDHAFRGVWVPQGQHVVTMSYVPRGLRAGLVAASLGLLLAYAVALTAAPRRPRTVRA